MGLLNSVIGALGGGLGGGRDGGQADLLQAVIATLAEGNLSSAVGTAGGLSGGLGGLVAQFEQAGLGNVIGSWIGTGRNLPVSADQLGKVLGSDVLGPLAKQVGMSQGEVSGHLSEILPQLVDKLTPSGHLADVSESGLGDLGSILGRFSKP